MLDHILLGRCFQLSFKLLHPCSSLFVITDVITNKEEQGWSSLKDYILEKEPRFSIFGDVHQPQASRWRLGRTECMNVGYFRANSNYLELTSLLQ